MQKYLNASPVSRVAPEGYSLHWPAADGIACPPSCFEQRRSWGHETSQRFSTKQRRSWVIPALPPSCFEQRRSWGHETSQRFSTKQRRSWVIPALTPSCFEQRRSWVTQPLNGSLLQRWSWSVPWGRHFVFGSHETHTFTIIHFHKNKDVLESLLTATNLLKYIYNLRNIAADKFWNSQNPWSTHTVHSGFGTGNVSALQTVFLQISEDSFAAGLLACLLHHCQPA